MSAYSILSVRKTTPPDGTTGNNWYCYIISNMQNTIVGYRRGDLNEVHNIAQDCVKHLNQHLRHPQQREFVRRAYPVADTDPLSAA